MYFYSSKDVPEDMSDEELNEENEKLYEESKAKGAKFGERENVETKYKMNEFKYFRKHSDLHGFIEDYWCKATYDENCNCKYVEITPQLLGYIRNMAENPPTEHSTGFFWGQSTSEDWIDTIELCEEIQNKFDNGERVFYYAWY